MPALFLVPSPLRASRAGRRLCDAEGGLLFGPQVLTPEALVPGLLAAAGDRRAVLTTLAERLLVLEAARETGGPFAGLDPAGGLSRALADAIAELRQGEVSAEAAASAARELAGGAGERLGQLAAALLAYERRLEGLRVLDAAAGLRGAAQALRRGAASEETARLDLLVVEGFFSPSPAAFDLMAALAERATRTLWRAPWVPERPDLCAPAEAALRRLEGLHEAAARREIQVAFPRLEDRAPRLQHVLLSVAGGPGGASPLEGGRLLARAGAGEEGEAEAAARLAADLLEEGFAAEDIAFIASRSAGAVPLLGPACAGQGVPFAAGRGLPLAGAPPVQAVRQALAAAPRLTRAAAESLARTSYLHLGEPPSRLGLWLDRAGAIDGRNDPEEALRARAARLTALRAAPERAALARAAEALREMKERLGPLAGPGTGREMAARLRAFTAAAGVRRRAARAEPEVACRDLAALARLEEVADGLAEGLALIGRGGERLGVAGYLPLLDLALAGAAAPVPPEPAAGAVELWPIEEAPGLSARAAVLLGCGRGLWPPPPRPDPWLREPDRAAVNRALRRGALPTAREHRAVSHYLAFSAMAAATERLCFTWAADGAGGPGDAPASLVLEALAALGEAPGEPHADPPISRARSAPETLRAAARLARAGRGEEALAALAAAGGGLVARGAAALARGRVEEERREALLSRRAVAHAGGIPARLAPALASALPDEWSPTQLETFAGCPYRLFLQLVLALPERQASGLDIDPRDEGGLAHAVLERYLSARKARGAWPLAGGEEDQAEAREVALELFARFEAEGRVGDPLVWQGRREAILARLDRFVAAEARLADGLAPALLEHRFGGSSGRPPLAFEDRGEVVRLAGRIDRVDADGDRLHVIDYKNARNGREHAEKLSEEALGVTSFQVPAYLLAAARELPGRRRLLASYALLRSAERTRPFEAEAGDGLFAVDETRRAEVRAAGGRTFADAVVAAVRQVRRGEFAIASRDCTGCGFGAVCRFPPGAEAER